MEFLGIGPLELLFIILIALLILGPKDLEKTGKSIGKGLSKLVKSDTWKTVRQASVKVRSLPDELMKEVGMEEMKQSLDEGVFQPAQNAWKNLDDLASEVSVAGSAAPEKAPDEVSSSDPKKISSPAPKADQSK